MQIPFWQLTIAAILLTIVSVLIQDGCFLDGIIYTTVAKNLAEGHGDFWETTFSQTFLHSYHEQPPLYFGLLSLFYRVFGTNIYVERLFCLCCFAVSSIYIYKNYTLTVVDEALHKLAWLPILLFATIPIVFWAYGNMVSETVMTPFVLMSVYYGLRAVIHAENEAGSLSKKIIYLLLSGFFIWCATMTKGIQGAFGLVVPAVYWLVFRKNNSVKTLGKTFGFSFILLLIPAIIYALLLVFNKNVYPSFEHYFHDRLIKAFDGSMNNTETRLNLLIILSRELLPSVAICVILVFFARKKLPIYFYNLQKEQQKFSLFFLAIGLAGSLPLMITLEQRDFYLVTGMPYFCLFLALFTTPTILCLQEKINIKSAGFQLFRGGVLATLLAGFTLVFINFSKTKRDNDILHDVYILKKELPFGDIISVPRESMFHFELQAYCARYHYLSLDVDTVKHNYYLIGKTSDKGQIPKGYDLLSLPFKSYDLYKLKK